MTAQTSRSRNPISIFGVWLTTIGAFAFIIYYVIEALGLVQSPYSGLIGFVVIPLVFLAGLLLIPLGIWREVRRRRAGKAPWSWPAVDLARGRTRQVVVGVAALTLVNLAIVTVATVGAVHYMETDEFCGRVCHTPMKPESIAHKAFPHAGVSCVSCHVGPGAAGTVRAKMNGARQAYEFVRGNFARPIASPARNIPAPAETCVRCHALDQIPIDRAKIIRVYDDDETSTETPTTIVNFTKVIHWHARPDISVEFVATDATRETIPYVQVTDSAGGVIEYLAEGVTARPAGELRRMDCLDCHSRPAHTMSASAEQAVDRAIAAGAISRELPFIRKEAVAALKVSYPNEDEATRGLRRRMMELYASTRPPQQVGGAADAIERLYRTNIFPDMKVTWGTYKSQAGHLEFSGCFRCHDDGHKAASGKAIRQDCEICHKVD